MLKTTFRCFSRPSLGASLDVGRTSCTRNIQRFNGRPTRRHYYTMKATVIEGDKAKVVHDRPVPSLRDDYVLIKTRAVALNPTDWKHVAYGRGKDGALIGCDYAGVVEEVGPAVTKSWKKGDRICGVAHGSNLVNPEDGAFADYIVAKGDVQMKIPDHLADEEAATLPLGAITVGQGLFQKSLGLNLPTSPSNKLDYVLINGGGTATGGLAVQFAKMSGYKVITICGAGDFDRLEKLGAAHCFDYHDPEAGRKVRDLTGNKLRFAWDTIALASTAKVCADALSSELPCRYGGTNAVEFPRDNVETSSIVMFTMFNEAFSFGPREFPASREDFDFAKKFMALTERLLAERKLTTHPVLLRDSGIEGIPKGLEELQAGKVMSGKLVYRTV